MDSVPSSKFASSPQRDQSPTTITHLHILYRFFFLYLEPFSTLVGAYYAYILPHTYLTLTHSTSAPATAGAVPAGTSVALAQLANLYVLFALNEVLVLRSTKDVRVWRALLSGLLVADVGHLWSVKTLGWRQYYETWGWNAMDAGNIGFVYVGAATRVCFLMGVGVRTSARFDVKGRAS